MTNATLSFQHNGTKTELTNSNRSLTSGGSSGMSLKQRTAGIDSLELNGEDFVILPVNGKLPNFNNRPNNTLNNNLKPAPGSTKITAFKSESHTANEFESAMASSFLSALFPLGGLLESMKHLLEGVHKLSEDSSTKVSLSDTQNINPKDSLNPNKAFLPSSPFEMPKRPPMELWQIKRANSKEEENKKKKKKASGLGSY